MLFLLKISRPKVQNLGLIFLHFEEFEGKIEIVWNCLHQ